MLKKLKPTSKFSQNILVLMTGTTVAQAIPIAISPILTRIYTPKDFGLFALFLTISSIFGSIANGRYELAIMLPKKDEDAINIFALCLIIASIISFILLIIIISYKESIVNLLQNKEIGLWLYFIPVSVFFIGLFNSLTYFNNRKEYYKDISKATIMKSIVLSIVQLSVGLLKSGASGLISGEILSRLIANGKLLYNIVRENNLINDIKKVKIIALAKKYKNFPKYSILATLANTSSYNIINIFISILYSVSTLGYYSLVQRVLGVPTSLIGIAISKVFFKEATSEKQKTGKAIRTFIDTIQKSFFISSLLFLGLYFIVEDLFSIVFGKEWAIAGIYAKILIPMFFIRFIIVSVSLIETIMEKQKIFLYFNISLFLASLLTIYVSYFNHLDIEKFLTIYSFVTSCIYLMYGYVMYKMAKDAI